MSWDTTLAQQIRFTVNVSGVERPHEELSWAQDITSDLPDSVSAGGQVAVRTGEITWSRQRLIENRTPSPWYRGPYWIPETGDPVTIDAHDGAGNTVRVFTGVIDTVEGDAFGNRSSKIVADIRAAGKVLQRYSLPRTGYPVSAPDGNGKDKRFATTPVWLIHEIIRELGHHAVPPPAPASKRILDAPLQGSTSISWSGAGESNAELVISHRYGYDTLDPVWSWGPDGFGISNALLEWRPASGGGTGADTVGISLVVYESHASDMLVRVRHGATTDSYVHVLADKTVRVSTYTDGSTTAHTIPTKVPSGPGPHLVSAVFWGGKINVRVAGVEHVVDATTPDPAVTKIRLETGPASCVAGIQVWHPTSLTDHPAANWKQTAAFRYGTGTHSTILTPSIRNRKARDVLDDYASSLLCPIWIDGAGVMQVVTGKGLHDQPVSLEVDALPDVIDLSYTMSMLDHRPTVEVTYAHANATNTTATTRRTVVWQGNGSNVDEGEPDETFIEVPDDEEWIDWEEPNQATRLTVDNVGAFQTGIGSWWGMSYDGDALTLASTGGSQIVETLNPWTWKVTTSAAAGVASGMVQTTSDGALFSARYRKFELPVIRARAKVKYEDRTVAATASGAGIEDGTLTHDTGKWVTTTAAANDLCQWVHSMVSTPTPVLEDLVIRFNPEVDAGKKIEVRAQDVFGADFEALVLSVDHRPYQGATTVTARVTKVTAYTETITDVDYAHIGQSLAYWEDARAGMTLDEVTADPYIL